MGMSADAKLAWGVDFGDPKNTGEGYEWGDTDSYDFEHKVMPGLFSFTEEPPDLPEPDWRSWSGEQRREWRAVYREPWEARRDTAIPLTFEHYGYEFGGTALVLKRSLAKVGWGCDPIDPASIAEPTAEELAAFATVLADIGHDGEPPKLLLMSLYG